MKPDEIMAEAERVMAEESDAICALVEGGMSLRAATQLRLSLCLEEMLDEPLRAAGVGRKERRRRVREAMKDPKFQALLPPGFKPEQSS
jgi:hypothetical protein